MWIDTHAHLADLDDTGLLKVIDRACSSGIKAVLNTATDIPSSVKIAGQSDKSELLFGAAGISPFDVVNLPASWEAQLAGLLSHPKIVAVGEIGLDATNPRYPALDVQRPVFEKQAAIARERDLPIIVHSRGMEQEVAEICHTLGIRKAVFHCFTGTREAAEKIIRYGYHISFSGIITFSKSVLEIAKEVPAERLFIETDSPYLAPVPHRGRQNEPAFVKYTGELLAKTLQIEPALLAEKLMKNFETLFNVKF